MKKITTKCKDCVFAIYDGSIQKDCELGRIQRFQKHGGVSFNKDADEFSCYTIHRFCNTCRNKNSEWAKNIDCDKYLSEVLKDIQLKLSIVTCFNDNVTTNDLINFLKSVQSQTILPLEVHIINQQKLIKLSNLYAELTNQNYSFNWHITTIIENNSDYLKFILNKIKGKYFSIFNLPFEIPNGFINCIDVALNIRLERISCIKGNEENQGMTYQTLLAKTLDGNEERVMGMQINENGEETEIICKYLFDKIDFLSKVNKEESFIIEMKEICNILK